MRLVALPAFVVLLLLSAAAFAQKKADPKPPKLQPAAIYKCVLGLYSNDGTLTPFATLQAADGKNMLSDDVVNAMRGKISIGEISYKGAGYIIIPADGSYEIDSNIGDISINGVKLGLNRKSGVLDFKKGIYPITLHEPNHGQPYLEKAKIKIVNKSTSEEVPIFNTGKDIQAFMNTPVSGVRPILVLPWDLEKSLLAEKLPKK